MSLPENEIQILHPAGILVKDENEIQPEVILTTSNDENLEDEYERLVADESSELALSRKHSNNSGITPIALASVLAATMAPEWMTRTVKRNGRELPSLESQMATMQAAEEKRQRKAAKRMKEFK